MFVSIWAGTAILVLLVQCLGADPFYPPGYDSNCNLDGQAMYPWLVRIWDVTVDLTMSHGTLVSYLAVVTVCAPFVWKTPIFKNIPTNYEVIGTRIKDARLNPDDTCTQTTNVREIITHPKCRYQDQEHWVSTLFDFSIFFLDRPFKIDSDSYSFPAAPSPVTALRFLTDVLSLNYMESAVCEVIHFTNHAMKNARMRKNPFVRSIVYPEPCTDLFCEVSNVHSPDQEANQDRKCMELIGERSNGTIACVAPTWTKEIVLPGKLAYDYFAGAPYTCNGTAYGHVAVTKQRNRFYPRNVQDFFLVTTFLRVWPWLTLARERFGAAWIKPILVEELNLNKHTFPVREEDHILPGRTSSKPRIAFYPFAKSQANSLESFFLYSLRFLALCGVSLVSV